MAMKEWFTTFSQNHFILALLIKIVLGIVVFFIAMAIIGLICSFFYAIFKRIVGGFNNLNRKLDRVCAPAGKRSNPWGMVVALGWAGIFYFAEHVSSRGVSEFWTTEAWFGLNRHQFVGVAIVVLVVLVGLITARLRYPVVLGVKLLRIPLDLISIPFRFIYMVTGIVGSLTGAIKPVEGTVYIGDGTSMGGGYPGGMRAPGYTYNPDSSDGNSGYGAGYQDNSGYSYSTSESGTTDGFAYLGEKNSQQRAADIGGADGYNYTTTASGSVQYFNGDYRPFSETGETVEVHHLDEGYVPMDND